MAICMLQVRFRNECRGDCDRRIHGSVVEFELDDSPVIVELVKQRTVSRRIRTWHFMRRRLFSRKMTTVHRMICPHFFM